MEKKSLIPGILKRIVPGHIQKGYAYYYRGQYGFNFPPTPSVMRTKGLSENTIVNRLVERKADEYANCSDVELLSKMEHSGVPTRLINITRSPLVSLFFSCDNIEEYKRDLFKKEKPSYVFRYRLVMSHSANGGRSGDRSVISAFEHECYTLRPFNSDSGILLSALSCLTARQQSLLRCDALMDFLGQCYADWISWECYSDDVYYGIRQAIKIQLRYLFRAFQNLVSHWSSDNNMDLTIEQMQKALCQELERKLFGHFLNRYYRIWDIQPFSISNSGGHLCLEVFGYRFVGEAIEPGFGFFYPDVDIEEVCQKEGCEHVKSQLIRFLSVDEDVMLVNPETCEYESASMCALHVHIKNRNPGFSMSVRPSTLLDGIFVSPLINFDRVAFQQGAFQLFGLSKFWNVRRSLVFFFNNREALVLQQSSGWIQNVIQVLIADDTSVLGKMSPSRELTRKDLAWTFARYVHRCRVYVINHEKHKQNRFKMCRELKMLGIDQGVIGLDSINTYSAMRQRE